MHERKDFTRRLLTLRVFGAASHPCWKLRQNQQLSHATVTRKAQRITVGHWASTTGGARHAKHEYGGIARGLRTLAQSVRTLRDARSAPGLRSGGIGPGSSAACGARQRPLERHRVLLEALLVAKTRRFGGRHLTPVRGAEHARVVEFATYDPFLDARRGAVDDGVNVVGRALQLALRNASYPRWVMADAADTSQTDPHAAQHQQQPRSR